MRKYNIQPIKTYTIIALLCLTPGATWAAEPDTAFNNQFRRDIGGWIAADATYSILLPDGRTLWLFGDTFIGEVDGITIVNGAKMIRNSAVIQEGSDLQTLQGGAPSAPDDFLRTAHPDSTWYWPEHGIVEDDTLRIVVAKFRHADTGTEGFNFAHAGNDIANLTYPGLEFINAVPLQAHDANGVIYGDRVLQDTSYLYIYGRKQDTSFYNIPFPHVARTTKGNLMNQASWEYYDGSGWSDDPAATAPFQDINVSQQYSVTSYHGKYILLTQDVWLSPEIWTYVSDSPVGPWENKTKIFTTPETSGSTFTYNAYAHPQFNKNNEMLVSYNVNGDFWSIFSNVELYRPQFIRIPYRNISYDFWDTGESGPRAAKHTPVLFPNPLTDPSMLQLKLPTAGTLSWVLQDLAGRTVASNQPAYHTAGVHTIALPGETTRDGSYIFRGMFNEQPFALQVIINTQH